MNVVVRITNNIRGNNYALNDRMFYDFLAEVNPAYRVIHKYWDMD